MRDLSRLMDVNKLFSWCSSGLCFSCPRPTVTAAKRHGSARSRACLANQSCNHQRRWRRAPTPYNHRCLGKGLIGWWCQCLLNCVDPSAEERVACNLQFGGHEITYISGIKWCKIETMNIEWTVYNNYSLYIPKSYVCHVTCLIDSLNFNVNKFLKSQIYYCTLPLAAYRIM